MSAPPHNLDPRPARYAWRDLMIIAALAAFVVIAFWDVFARGSVFFFRDFALFFYPKRFFAAEAIRHGRIPFWNPYGSCGEPLLGAYQPAVFYPLAVIYYLLPMPQSFMWFVVLHFFLSGAGAYYMMRVWGARRSAAAFTAFAWAFSPSFVGSLDYVSFMTSLSWLPWCLAFARRLADSGTFRAFAFLSLSFAMAVMAAAPEPVIFIALILLFYALWRCGGLFLKRGIRAAWRPGATILAAVGTGMLLSGVELAPFLHTLRYSVRHEGLSVEDSGKWSASPDDALLLFLPRFALFADRGGIYWHGQYWLKTVYLGALIPLLAVWTLLAVRRARNWFFAVVAALFVLMAAGPNSPLWVFVYKYIPGAALIRYPIKFYLPVAFALAALAGFAIDDLLVSARKKELLRPMLLLALVALSAVAFGVGWWLVKEHPVPFLPSIMPKGWLPITDIGQERLQDCWDATQWSFGRSAYCLAAGAAALAVVMLLARFRIPRPYGGVLLVAVLFLDVAFFGAHLNPLAGPEVYTENPGHLAAVPHGQTDKRLFMTPALRLKLLTGHLAEVRSFSSLMESMSLVTGIRFQTQEEFLEWLRPMNPPAFADVAEFDQWLRETMSSQFKTCLEYQFHKETFYPNLNTLYAVAMVDGFEPMAVKWHESILKELRNGKVPQRRDLVLARMWGAGVISDLKQEPPAFAYLPIEIPGSRAFLTDQVISAKTDQSAFDMVAHGDVDTSRCVVLAEPDADTAARFISSRPASTSSPGTVRLLGDSGNRCAFEVRADRNALLFVADNYFPNFAALVDGKPAPLWRANYAYRAVPIAPGNHVVEFYWRPYDFYVGLAVTAAGVVVLIAAFVRARKKACA